MADQVRYAVVGLGYIAQAAVLPAFAHAAENSKLVALVSDDPAKRSKLARKYDVSKTYAYEEFDDCLSSGEVDAVYIALPNNLHAEYTKQAASARVHVLCEKPMAVTEEECEAMIRAADDNDVRLMIAYRLHFEEANLKAIEIVESGKLGDARIFDSVFTQQVLPGNTRLRSELGGGTLYDIGIYCINAARYLFRDEPEEVTGFTATTRQERFREVEEMTSAILRFPGERLATFTSSFGAAEVSAYRVVGTEGDLRVDPAYEFARDLKHELTIDGKTTRHTFKKRDQFAPLLLYFSGCVLEGAEPEPSGREGLADVRVIRALYESAQTGRPVRLGEFRREHRPSLAQEVRRPAVRKPALIHAASPSGD